MNKEKGLFEVEFRCHFDNPEDAYHTLPFLRSCLKHRVPWTGTLYGRELFKSGGILRTGQTNKEGKIFDYLTWKGPDTGGFCNIRQEIGEDITHGITNSEVFEILGGKMCIQNVHEAAQELERLGHPPFMLWKGIDIYGFYQPNKTNVKLMYCDILKWPWIVEFEKVAKNREEADRCEIELYQFSREFWLWTHIFKEEPTQLLYQKTFPEEPI
jgi:hypothetical protein